MAHKQSLVVAIRTMLRPIVRLLIAMGFSAKDFIEIAKTVFVEVASEDYGKRNRPANTSRIALLTGLTRRETARLRLVSDHDPLPLADPMVPIGRVLSDWFTLDAYQSEDGKPKTLSLEDTFRDLIEQHRADIPPTTMIKEMVNHGCISIDGDKVTVHSRYFMPFELDRKAIERFGVVMADMGNTITNNLLSSDRTQALFEGRAVNELVSIEASPAFRSYLERRALALLEEVDDWLTDHTNGDETERLGVGIYTIGAFK